MARLSGLDTVQRAIENASAPDKRTDQPGKKNAAEVIAVGRFLSEPEPLRAQLPTAEPYPVEALGDTLCGAAKALHESVKAPLAMCCQSVLAAASLAAQAHYDIKLPWGERKPLSLFLLTVGESGERKSGIDDLVLGAAKTQERADMEIYHADLKIYETELASWTHAADAARRTVTSGKKGSVTASEVCEAVERCGDRPEAPIAPLRFVSDPTVEGLYKLLAGGQPNVALFSDEGGLLIGGHALNSDNALKTMARWCKLWDGSPFDRVRAGDGAGVLYGRRMALHQLAQPDVMTTLLSDRMANGQGLLARCLVAWPKSTIGERHIERFEWAGERREVKRLYAVSKTLLEAQPSIGNSPQELVPIELPLSEAAKHMAVAAGNQFESLMAKGADLSELRDRTSKALENACRIAGVLTVIDNGLASRQIETDHLARALVLVQWYLNEALRIRGAAAIPQSVTDAEMLSAWLKEKGTSNFRTKKVLNSGPSQLRNKARLMAAIRELVQCGYLIENDSGTVVDGVAARASWRVIHHVV
ncbi:MAG: YfjI family protein [Candidatus Nitrotoga sp.]